jgi:hypothetical protein
MTRVEADCRTRIVTACWRWQYFAGNLTWRPWPYARALGLHVWQNVHDKGI